MARPEVSGRKITTKTEREIDRKPGKRSADAGQLRPEVGSREIGVESAQQNAHRIRGPPVPDAECDAFSIAEFCRRHRISVQAFYKFRHLMPPTFTVGVRRLISKESAATWRRAREAASAAEQA